eukprot:XP_001702255.1 predicted protein [Chlamydomonas reinhardtii]
MAWGMGIAAGIGGISALACVVVQWYLQSPRGRGFFCWAGAFDEFDRQHQRVAALARALTGHAQPPTAGADSSSVSTSSPSGPQQAAVAGGGEPVGATGKPGVSGFSQTLVWTGVAVFAAWFIGDSVKGGLQSAGNSVQEGLTDAAKEHGSRTAWGMGIAAGIGGIFALACVVVQWYLQSR